MSHSMILIIVTAMILGFVRFGTAGPVDAQAASNPAMLDARVSGFLDNSRNSWRDLNVSYEDGELLHNLIMKGNFKNILEIGTSTGHSTVWLAWAAAKTGGRVTTIEIDKSRHESALANFRKAGVESFIDARLADAHELVPTLKGPFDFVFCDADKEWYLQYFIDLAPKISINGCFTAHNVSWSGNPIIMRFLDQVRKDARFRTTVERGNGEGISVSRRTGK